MKILIRQDYISCMSKVGTSEKPSFLVGVYEDGSHIGEPYLKIYNSSKYSSSTHVTRLSMRDGHRIIHKNVDGRLEWDIDKKTLKALEAFLEKKSRQFVGYTNWQAMIYLWNYEPSTITPAPEDVYDSDIEAFYDGYYDTEENSSNPNYMRSDSEIPSFAK